MTFWGYKKTIDQELIDRKRQDKHAKILTMRYMKLKYIYYDYIL